MRRNNQKVCSREHTFLVFSFQSSVFSRGRDTRTRSAALYLFAGFSVANKTCAIGSMFNLPASRRAWSARQTLCHYVTSP